MVPPKPCSACFAISFSHTGRKEGKPKAFVPFSQHHKIELFGDLDGMYDVLEQLKNKQKLKVCNNDMMISNKQIAINYPEYKERSIEMFSKLQQSRTKEVLVRRNENLIRKIDSSKLFLQRNLILKEKSKVERERNEVLERKFFVKYFWVWLFILFKTLQTIYVRFQLKKEDVKFYIRQVHSAVLLQRKFRSMRKQMADPATTNRRVV